MFGGYGAPEPEPYGAESDPRHDEIVPAAPHDPLLDEIMRDKVLQYRCGQFIKAGFTLRQSRVLACNRTVDLHFVIEGLLGRGCDVDTAFDIAA